MAAAAFLAELARAPLERLVAEVVQPGEFRFRRAPLPPKASTFAARALGTLLDAARALVAFASVGEGIQARVQRQLSQLAIESSSVTRAAPSGTRPPSALNRSAAVRTPTASASRRSARSAS